MIDHDKNPIHMTDQIPTDQILYDYPDPYLNDWPAIDKISIYMIGQNPAYIIDRPDPHINYWSDTI